MAESEALTTLRETCKDYLTKAGLKFLIDMDQDFRVPYAGGVDVIVMPCELRSGRLVVRVEALLVKGLRVDGELGLFLSEENSRLIFGKLCLYPDSKSVHFEDALLGEFLNEAELTTAVGIVATMANEYDDRLKEKWGGEKWSEL